MTTKQMIQEWFECGVNKQSQYMLVVCDTFDYADYPVYCDTPKQCMIKYKNPGNMQRIMEVYNLLEDMDEQLNTVRTVRLPSME